jgi:hypothetical protein
VFLICHMRIYPFVIRKHNIMEAIGEATLLVMYAPINNRPSIRPLRFLIATVPIALNICSICYPRYTTCLLLRNDAQESWDDEWVTRNGYGWMLVIMYTVICPSPMIYSVYLRLTNKEQAGDTDSDVDVEFQNPLGDGGDGNGGLAPLVNPEQRARMAKQQQRKAKSLATELAQAQKLAAQAQEELTELKAKAAAASSGPGGIASGVAYSLDTRRASQVNALNGLVDDKLVDQETVQKAQQRFSKHVLYEIETETHTDSLREFLNSPEVRLGHHAQAFVAVGGAGMAAEDVQFLSAAEMTQVTERAQMTHMEARRLAAVVQGQVRPQAFKTVYDRTFFSKRV